MLPSIPQQSSPQRPVLLLQPRWKRGDITKQAVLPACAIPRKLALEETRANACATSSMAARSKQVRHKSSQVKCAPAVLIFFERAILQSPPAKAWAVFCEAVSQLALLLDTCPNREVPENKGKLEKAMTVLHPLRVPKPVSLKFALHNIFRSQGGIRRIGGAQLSAW